jgi:hypothetical protein
MQPQDLEGAASSLRWNVSSWAACAQRAPWHALVRTMACPSGSGWLLGCNLPLWRSRGGLVVLVQYGVACGLQYRCRQHQPGMPSHTNRNVGRTVGVSVGSVSCWGVSALAGGHACGKQGVCMRGCSSSSSAACFQQQLHCTAPDSNWTWVNCFVCCA